MTATADHAIARLDAAEYGMVDALAGLPAASNGGMREKVLAVLEKVRATKRVLMARSPDILRKASAGGGRAPAAPHWVGLPVVEAEASAMVKAARDRQAEELRLAKASGRAPDEPGDLMPILKQTLRQPITGDRALVSFLNRRAGR